MTVPISREEADQLFREVKANHARLDACAGPHDFQVNEMYPHGKLVRNYKCSKCGGIVETLHKNWYERGLAHGRAVKP